jgi:hypothetical protein
MENKQNDYSDIIHLPHHVSKAHPQMSMQNRAAQFSPFAALSGYEDAVDKASKEAQFHEEWETAEEFP